MPEIQDHLDPQQVAFLRHFCERPIENPTTGMAEWCKSRDAADCPGCSELFAHFPEKEPPNA